MNPSDAPIFSPGVLLGGKYRVVRVIGQGGMGTVVLAKHMELGQRFAIKVLSGDLAKDGESVARFLREARACVKLQSDHVVRVSDIGSFEGIGPYIVMEYLKGADLGHILAAQGPLAPTLAVDYVLEALDAIAEAHSLGIVHRDLKPSNLFLAERADGRRIVKVLDFGISKMDPLLEARKPHHKLTATRTVLGSPSYMSPEQLKSSRDVDARADIWSLGVVLYELISGTTPFEAETAGGIFTKVVSEDPRPLGDGHGEAPGLEQIIRRCLRRKVEERFATVGELALALRPYASVDGVRSLERRNVLATSGAWLGTPSDHEPGELTPTAAAPAPSAVTVGSVTVPTPPPAWAGASDAKRRWALGLGVGGLVLAIAGTTMVLYLRQAPSDAPSAAAPTSADPPPVALGATPSAEPLPPAAPDRLDATLATAPAPPSTGPAGPSVAPSAVPHLLPRPRVPPRPPSSPSFLDKQR